MCWLRSVDAPVEQFNLMALVQAPAGVTEADVVVMLQALLDRHAMLRLRVDDGGPAGWSLTVPEAGSVDAGSCLERVAVLSDEALVRAQSRLNPAGGVMLSALWVADTAELVLIANHLAVDVVSWRILLDDLNTAWGQRRLGHEVVLPAAGTSFRRWASVLREYARRQEVVDQAGAWKQVTEAPAALPAVQPAMDTFAAAGHLSASLDVESTRMLLGEVPAAFHAGIHDVLLIAFALAWAEFLGNDGAPIGIDVEGHGRHEELGTDVDLSRTVGWFTAKYPVSLAVGGVRWEQVVAGEAALGAVIKDAKEQLRALPHPLTYGVLRYLGTDAELAGSDPPIGFNYLGRLGLPMLGASADRDVWRIVTWGSLGSLLTDSGNAGRSMPLMHTVDVNAVTVDSDTGPQLHANWTWAPSALDRTQVSRLGRLWFDALAGICAHVRGGRGGLTPSDIAPAHLSQQQIDQLHQQHKIADILPLTPLQHGLLLHAGTAQAHDDDLYAVQLDITLSGRLDQHRLRDAVQTLLNRYPNLAARFCPQFDEPVQVIPADPAAPWRYVELDAEDLDPDEQIQRLCAAERAAVGGLADQPAFRAALIRTAPDQHRFVLTHHYIVMDGQSIPTLLQEIFASYHRERLPAPASYRSFVTWLVGRDLDAARTAWREMLAGFDTPTLVGPPARLQLIGRRGVESFRVAEEITCALSELAHSHHTTVNTVLQGAWAQLLMGLTGHHDIAFGAVVSGRPAAVAGAESMVGMLINTVPVRANITAATTTADLLDQLQRAHEHTVDHQHLALSDIHRITGHELLFDTLFVYESYPIDTTVLLRDDDLAITGLGRREYNHYPLAVQVMPGRGLGIRIQFDTDGFDAETVEALIERFKRVLVEMTTDPTRRLSSIDLLDAGEHARLDEWDNRAVLTQPEATPRSLGQQSGRRASSVEVRPAVSPASDLQHQTDDMEAERKPRSKRLRYADYLHLDELLAAVQPLFAEGDHSAWSDERYFLVIHQTSELWVSQILADLELALESARLADFDRAIDRLKRANAALELTLTTQSALEHLSVDDFHRFRPKLQGVSAAQSEQFAILLEGARYAPVAELFQIVADRRDGESSSRRQKLQIAAQLNVFIAGLTRWRLVHLEVVRRFIGDSGGTGGTAGVGYLIDQLDEACRRS
jgi:non-ribosomal peptide synthase protein (TIGR01720 family)